ncbi:hypothetical protein J7643_07320 [bacterium]|nr:hypothetical protein [bacterium]
MMERIDRRVLLGGIAGAALVGGLTYYVLAIRPAAMEAATLRAELERVIRQRDVSAQHLAESKARVNPADDEIQRLKLFDLRKEQSFDTALANRSNVGLIALSEILQRHAITIEALTPGPIDEEKISVQSVPQAGVLHRRYQIRAQGQYQDVQAAFGAFKTLPPALEIDQYDIQYIGAEGNRARVLFQLGFGFNFLVSLEQLERFAELASASVVPAPAFTFSSPAPAAAPAATPAPASPAPVSARESWWSALAGWLDPVAVAAPSPKPTKSPAPGPKTYSFSVDRGVTLGRVEPFLPLGAAREMPAPVILPKPVVAPAPVTALPSTQLLAVLLSNNGQASALLQVGNDRLRVRAGSMLSGGGVVAAIGKDFVLVRQGGALHRIGLSAGEASSPAAAAHGAPPAVPDFPSVPALQIPGEPTSVFDKTRR